VDSRTGEGRVLTRRTIWILAAILLAQTVIVAMAYTPQPHSGGDNAGYISLAHSLLDRGAYLELWAPGDPPHTKYPPVFPAILALAILLGAKSWAALKLVPAVSTILAVSLAFLWARERRGAALGLVVALLLGLSESVVYYSQWILSDPTFLAFTLAALWALQKGSKAREPGRNGVGYGLWLPLGMALVVLAYFTRSAGLPLALATAVWLGHRKQWKPLAVFVVAFGLPALLWWLRGSAQGGSGYVSEFWLLDPYQPHLGTVGLGGLLDRVAQNLTAYVTGIIPGGIVGDSRPFLPPFGLALASLTLVGWIRTLREEVGPAELFFPLYFGLILLWPPAWSGDRFALPLLPLAFYYSGVASLWILGPVPARARGVVLALPLLVVSLFGGQEWRVMANEAGQCREMTRMGSAHLCLSPAQGEYFALAEWSGRNLPDGAVVTTRKPRIFYLMSGVKALSIPLEREADLFLDQMRKGNSRYVSLDLLDGMSGYYVYPVVAARLSAFCGLVQVGTGGQAGTRLLGFPGGNAGEESGGVGAGTLPECPADMVRAEPRGEGSPEGWEIPLLVWGTDR
jgi:hypothetical protein